MTAETVMVLPVLVAVTAALAWLVSLAAVQARVVDAARETARATARGDPAGQAVALGRRVAPDGCGFDVDRGSAVVVVRVRCPVTGPSVLGSVLPDLVLTSEAVAAQEPR